MPDLPLPGSVWRKAHPEGGVERVEVVEVDDEWLDCHQTLNGSTIPLLMKARTFWAWAADAECVQEGKP